MTLIDPDALVIAAAECMLCNVLIAKPTDAELKAFNQRHPILGRHILTLRNDFLAMTVTVRVTQKGNVIHPMLDKKPLDAYHRSGWVVL